MRRFTDLEHSILGIIFKKSPCTSYMVAREFSGSSSSYWRGSAGTVYPAIDRLKKFGMLTGKDSVSLGRPCSLYSLTAKGLTALCQWLTPPLPPAAASITFDPIRTRAFFLAALSDRERRAFLDDAERQLKLEIPALVADCRRYRQAGDRFSELAQRGTLHVMKARLRWIQELRKALSATKTRKDRLAP